MSKVWNFEEIEVLAMEGSGVDRFITEANWKDAAGDWHECTEEQLDEIMADSLWASDLMNSCN